MSEEDKQEVSKPERSPHAEQRRQEGRRTGAAFNDAQRAKRGDVFIDDETGRYVLRGSRGREHVFEPDGELVTTIDRPYRAHLNRLRSGRIREITEEDFKRFQEIFQ